MPDTQTIYEFRIACHKPGCPICRLIQRAGTRYIEQTLNESLLDPGIRQKLLRSMGFCHEHTWESISSKLSDALGHAILYQDLLLEIIKTITESEEIDGSLVAKALNPVAECPACRIEEATLERIIEGLVIALREQISMAALKQSDGLCIPHLRLLLPRLDREQQKVVLESQITCMEDLKMELTEFIRKNDYRFRDEIIGREGDSYKRAADMIGGKHLPSEKKDLR